MPEPEMDVFGSPAEAKPVEEEQEKKEASDTSDQNKEGGANNEGGKDNDEGKNKGDGKKKETVEEKATRLEKENAILVAKGEVKDENLKGQRQQLERLTKGKGDEKVEVEKKDLPYPEVRYSKDLSEEEREELSAHEISQMDVIANMQTKENDKFIEGAQKTKEDDDTLGNQLETKAKEVAMELAGNDKEVANSIIAEFNTFEGNDKLTDAQLKERMEKATKLVPDYKPPKEQPSGGGAPAKKSAGGDKFGNDAFLDDLDKEEGDGGFSL